MCTTISNSLLRINRFAFEIGISISRGDGGAWAIEGSNRYHLRIKTSSASSFQLSLSEEKARTRGIGLLSSQQWS